MSETKKGKKLSKEHIEKLKGKIPWNKGKSMPEEARTKMSIARLGKSGEGLGNWKDGRTKKRGYNTFTTMRRRARIRGNGGSHTFAEWETLKAQYNFTCPSCHKSEPEIKLSEDHIIPLKRGGSDNIENIQPLCMPCNSRKQTKIIKYEF